MVSSFHQRQAAKQLRKQQSKQSKWQQRRQQEEWQQWLESKGSSDTPELHDELWSQFLEEQRLQKIQQEAQRRQEAQEAQEAQQRWIAEAPIRAAKQAEQKAVAKRVAMRSEAAKNEIAQLLLEAQQKKSIEERLFNAKHGTI